MRNSTYIATLTASKIDDTSPLKLSTRFKVSPNLCQLHTFGCPLCMLHGSLQAGRLIPKCNPQLGLRVNLGPSPKHGRHVSLILSPTTDLSCHNITLCMAKFRNNIHHGLQPSYSLYVAKAGWIDNDQV